MNSIFIFNENPEVEPLLIRELTQILPKSGDYYLCRAWKNGPHIKAIFNKEFSTEDLLEAREKLESFKHGLDSGLVEGIEIQLHLGLEEENEALNIMKLYPINNKLIHRDLFHEMRCYFQEILTDVYFYIKINNIKKDLVIPILIYYVSRVLHEQNQSLFEWSITPEIHENSFNLDELYRENASRLFEFEKEHEAFLNMWYGVWSEMFYMIREKISIAFGQVSDDAMYDQEGIFKKEQAEYDILATKTVTNLLYACLPFLHVHHLENGKFIYFASCFAEEKAQAKVHSMYK